MSVLDMIYEKYFILGYDDNNKLVMTKINKPTFQFKQQVKWGVISKSDYNYIMIRMYGRYFYSFLKGCVDLTEFPKQIVEYLVDNVDNEVNRELYYSLVFGMVYEREFKGTFLYKNIKGNVEPKVYLQVYNLIKSGKLKI